MTTTAGRKSELARTERSVMSIKEFQDEVFKLDASAESINMMIYGASNAGKTVLAGTCPTPVFWLVGEPGYKSAVRQGARGYGRRIRDTASAWAAVEWLETKNRYEKFNWVVLDGLSTMQDRFRLSYAAEAFDANPAKRAHRNLPDRPDYFNTQNFLKAWIPRLVDLPVNLLITAHAWQTDETDAELYMFPGIQGKVTDTAQAISGLMDAVGYLEVKDLKDSNGDLQQVRRLLWQRTTRKGVTYFAGDKFGTLGRYMDDPTMPEIIARIEGDSA